MVSSRRESRVTRWVEHGGAGGRELAAKVFPCWYALLLPPWQWLQAWFGSGSFEQCGSGWAQHGSVCVSMGSSQQLPPPHWLPWWLWALLSCSLDSPSGCQPDNCDELSPQIVDYVEFSSCGKFCFSNLFHRYEIYFHSNVWIQDQIQY